MFYSRVEVQFNTLYSEAIQIGKYAWDTCKFKAFVFNIDIYNCTDTWHIFLIHKCSFNFVPYIVPVKFIHFVFVSVHKVYAWGRQHRKLIY